MKNIIIVILIVVGLVFVVNEFEIFGIKFWGVRKANAQTEVFKQSQVFTDGMAQELAKYRHEWLNKTDPTEKTAIESVIRAQFANVDVDAIQDIDLRQWLREIKNK